MPRDLLGNYTLPAGNPVVTLTPIQTNWANPTLTDVATALTDSLDRQGRGGMLAPFKFADGTIALPSGTFTNEPTLGFYRKGAAQFAFSVSGSDAGIFNATGLTLPLGGVVTGGAFRITRTAATARFNIDSDAGQAANVAFRTGTISRWQIGKDTVAEGGADAGSNYLLERFDDAGASLGPSLSIIRSTGAATFGNSLTVNGPNLIVGTDAQASPQVRINGVAGTDKTISARTAAVLRWQVGASGAEGGANAGADWIFNRHNDAGAFLGTALLVRRSTGEVVIGSTVEHQAVPGLTVVGGLIHSGNASFVALPGAAVAYNFINLSATGGFAFNVNANTIQALTLNGTTGVATFNAGQLNLNAGAVPDPVIVLNSAAGRVRACAGQTSGLYRWDWGVFSEAETGSDAGANFYIRRFNDAGVGIDRPLTINRATGVVNFNLPPTVGGSPLAGGLVVVSLTAAQTITSAAIVAIAGLAVALLTGTRYMIRATLLLSNSNITGYSLGATWSGAASAGGTTTHMPQSAGTPSAAESQFDTNGIAASATFGTVGANAAAGTNWIATFITIFSPTAGAGTYTPAAASSGAGTITVRAGSMIEVIRLA